MTGNAMRPITAGIAILVSLVAAASAAEMPKHGGILTYMMPADAYRSCVKGFKISPSHCVNEDLATIWLDK